MDEILARGTIKCFGDDINTDYIVPSHRKKETIDPDVLKHFVFEDIREGFFETLGPRTVLVAGRNFGCGSAMEIAVTVLQSAGIEAVIAQSFARTFKRNAINNGLLLCEVEAGHLDEGGLATVGLHEGTLTVDLDGCHLRPAPLPDFMLAIFRAGGLIPYLRERGDFEEA